MNICQLCETEKTLVRSHIIPKFVFNWLKSTSPGHIREYKTPNLRVQDGLALPMLCSQCESLLSAWENDFAQQMFFPIHDTQTSNIRYPYKEWALKFAVSVSWRVLKYGSMMGLDHFSEEQLEETDKALSMWREFLLGFSPSPGRYEQHVVPLDLISDHSLPSISGFLNRYLVRSVDMDIFCTDTRAYVYAKMGRVMLLGMIQEPYPKQWKGTKLHVRKGFIGSKKYVTPFSLDKYLNNRADRVAASLRSISKKQAEKIRARQTEDPQKFLSSEIFQAIQQDLALSGLAAFDDKNASETKKPGA